MFWTQWLMVLAAVWLIPIAGGHSAKSPGQKDAEVPSSLFLTSAPSERETGEDSPSSQTGGVDIPITSMSTGAVLSAGEIFRAVSPAVVFVETPRGRGSAVLIEPGYLVTNAHVVWPYERVRVVYPNGTEAEGMRVLGWDLIADLAVISPPDTDIAPLRFTDGSSLTVGSDVYLLGYPGEVDRYPQPAMTKGLLSRTRRWEPIDLSIFQVDSDISGGQSGGALLSNRGEFIGISTFYFTESRYALALSAHDIVPRLQRLLNEDAAAFSDRRPMSIEHVTEVDGKLENHETSALYFLHTEPGAKARIEVSGVGSPYFTIHNGYGQLVATSQAIADKTQAVAFTAGRLPPYLLTVEQQSLYRNTYTLTSTEPFSACPDPDDGKELTVGDTLVASLDAPGEFDVYQLTLMTGQKIALSVDSLVFDPYVAISHSSGGNQEMVFDDDGGDASVFGNGARLIYEAREDSTLTVVVGDAMGNGNGGYYLTIDAAGIGEAATRAEFSREFYRTWWGLSVQYESDLYDFAMMVPANWAAQECSSKAAACYAGPEASLMIAEEQVTGLPAHERNSSGYMDQMERVILSDLPDGQLVRRSTLTTQQGKQGEVVHMTEYGGLVQVSVFVYVDRDGIAFTAALAIPVNAYLDEPDFSVAENLFASFRSWEGADPEEQAIFHLERGARLAAQGAYAEAIAAIDEAITLDETLLDAYRTRAGARTRMGEYNLALSDIDILLAMKPDDYTIASSQAWICWHKGDFSDALAASSRARKLQPQNLSLLNNHALYAAATGDYEAALDAMERYANIVGGELPAHVLDTRAYVLFSGGEYERALVDYNAALDNDFKTPVTLLGAGLSHARLGDSVQAIPMLTYGMELLEKGKTAPEPYSPQLADLMAQATEYLDALITPAIPG